MKSDTRPKAAKGEPLEERFHRFAKALMAVPKKELDKELARQTPTKKKKERRNGKTPS
jgi:hypothetical protein